MSKGQLALVLHAHLPYVRSSETSALEEDWFFQALLEAYLPLVELLETANEEEGQNPRMTLSLSPTLLSLLSDKELIERFPSWLLTRLDLLANASKKYRIPADHLAEQIEGKLAFWESINADLISRFVHLQKSGVLDLLTCAATHGYLPLLREHYQAVQSQLSNAVREHTRLIGVPPLGIWLPECAYYEGLDHLMQGAGLRYAVLDGHGLLHATPRPLYGLYAPICTRKGVAFFGRDSDSTLPVWSATEGYPGDPVYREFHRDLGWELSPEQLDSIGINDPRPLGLKLHRVTGVSTSLEKKACYEPNLASSRVIEHARDYLKDRKAQLDQLESSMNASPLLVAPFDAELFGHWWYEGPSFLSELFRQSAMENVSFTRLVDVLSGSPKIQLCEPSPSSWGQGGFHNYWLNEANSWIVPEWNRSAKAMIECCSCSENVQTKSRLLKQASRELLLAQSSDWSFILRAGTTTELAKNRIERHLNRFWILIKWIKGEEDFSEDLLASFEIEDGLFPLVEIKDWVFNKY